jgi:hypothetical protein
MGEFLISKLIKICSILNNWIYEAKRNQLQLFSRKQVKKIIQEFEGSIKKNESFNKEEKALSNRNSFVFLPEDC